jgi:hypothetical protein
MKDSQAGGNDNHPSVTYGISPPDSNVIFSRNNCNILEIIIAGLNHASRESRGYILQREGMSM